MKASGIWTVALALPVAALALAGCASVPKLAGNERIAIVGFSLDKSIVKTGAQPDSGPGILILGDKAAHYAHHQEALDLVWAAFKKQAPSIFGDARLVDIGSTEGNPELLSVTAPVTKKNFLGISSSSDDRVLHPAGVNYVALDDSKRNARIAAAAKADLIVSIDLQAEYGTKGGGGGQVTMILTAKVGAAEASGRLIRSATVSGQSRNGPVLLTIGSSWSLDPSEFPRLMADAWEDLGAKLAKEVARW